MSRNNHNAPLTAHVVRYSSSLLLAALLAVSKAYALDTGDIVIVSLKGEVHVTMKGAQRAVQAGAVLELPATVQTGRDGTIDLRQGATSVSVGPDTLLEFPALERAGGPIDRIVQPRGNAFYSIGKRGGRKLRVETPFLVGVVKGTQFNVAAQGDKTTISLFEGLLEIRASDDSSVVDIKAGEIATRSLADTSIGVLRMDAGKTAPAPRVPPGSRNDSVRPPVTPQSAGSASHQEQHPAPPTPGVTAQEVASTGDSVSSAARDEAPVAPAALPAVANGFDAAMNAPTDGAAVAPDVFSPRIDAVAAAADMSATANPHLGAAGVDPATAVDVAAPAAIEATANLGVNPPVGTPTVDLGAADPVAVGDRGGVDAAPGAAIELGHGNAASVDVNAGAQGGPLSTGAGAGVAVDLGDVQGAAHVDIGNPVAADAVDLGPDKQDDHGPDSGANDGGGNQGSDSGKGNGVDDAIDTVDGALNGLLRKPGKK